MIFGLKLEFDDFINIGDHFCSMSNADRELWTERFRQNHPLEFFLGLEIAARFEDIAKDVYYGTRIPPTKIEFQIMEHPETTNPMLAMSGLDGMLFIAAIARTVIEHTLSIIDNSGELRPKLMERAKQRAAKIEEEKTTVTKCNICGHDNKYYENYCTKCGNKLRE